MSEQDPLLLMQKHRAPRGAVGAAIRQHRKRRSAVGPALAAAALFVGGVGVGAIWTVQGMHGPAVEAAPVKLVSTHIVFHAPSAATVGVAGSWNDWKPDATPMVAIGGGLYRAVVTLPPGEYEYQIVLDGEQWVADPSAAVHREDDFGSVNSVLML